MEALPEAEALALGLRLAEPDAEPLTEAEDEGLRLALPEADPEALALADGLREALPETEAEALELGERLADPEAEPEDDGDREALGLELVSSAQTWKARSSLLSAIQEPVVRDSFPSCALPPAGESRTCRSLLEFPKVMPLPSRTMTYLVAATVR